MTPKGPFLTKKFKTRVQKNIPKRRITNPGTLPMKNPQLTKMEPFQSKKMNRKMGPKKVQK